MSTSIAIREANSHHGPQNVTAGVASPVSVMQWICQLTQPQTVSAGDGQRPLTRKPFYDCDCSSPESGKAGVLGDDVAGIRNVVIRRSLA